MTILITTQKMLVTALMLILALTISAPARSTSPNDGRAAMEKATLQFREFTLGPSPTNPDQALKFATSLREDGSWSDIDYKSNQRAAWPTSGHLSRVLTMTTALANSKLNTEQASTLENAIHKALAYWRVNDFQCPNWWHNNIGVPKYLGPIALLLGNRLQKDEFDYITKTVMPRGAIGMTGQNKVWLAGITLMDAMLRNDEKKAAEAASVIFSEVVITDAEGIQPDFSFHQHGPQLQFGNYGSAFSDDQLKWAQILQGTPWAMPADKLAIIAHYLLDGEDWVIWKGVMDISCCGRQISPGSPEGKGKAISRQLNKLAVLDPAHAPAAQASAKRNQPAGINDLVGTRFFWRSDYVVSRRKDIFYTLKMSSKRVIGGESINSENLSGYYLADGAMYTYRTATEYQDIFPVWDWRKIPGVTCAQSKGPLPSFVNARVDSDFVGGASDGVNTCAVLDYNRDGVSAKKAWFFRGDQAVCLGAAIKSDEKVSSPLATTINQCRLNREVRVQENGRVTTLQPGTHNSDNLRWVEHDGVRYTFLQPQTVVLSNQKVTGNWSKVIQTTGIPKSDITMDIFTLYIDHGTRPNDATYAYSIAPTGNTEKAPTVLSNTEAVQAIRFGNIIEAVFYTPGSIDCGNGHKLTVDSPCAVILNVSGSEPRVTVADPRHNLKTLRVTVDDRQFEAKMPGGATAGRSVGAIARNS